MTLIRAFAFLFFLISPILGFSQGFNKFWLLGTDTGFPMGRIEFDSNSHTLFQQQYKMTFKGTQATICNANGNFLMSSNGVWIANANNDTMMNGGGLNPSLFTTSYPLGLPLDNADIILSFPNDTNKFILVHHSAEFDGFSYPTYKVFYTIIDMTLDSGRGGVISKNNIALQDTLNWGLAACRHANGRDWWVIASKQNSSVFFKILFTPNGIESITSQQLNLPVAYYSAPISSFTLTGDKFITNNYDTTALDGYLEIMDFDRCAGVFSNEHSIKLTDGEFLWGVSFSSNGNYAYAASSNNIFQVDVNTLAFDTVATYDGFCFPNNPWCTTFYNMYLAANGKIYITSGNAVQHIHEMNFPDSAGMACDVQQHSIFLNGIWNFRAVPNHPNYYLGRLIGSPCDTVWQGVEEVQHDFRFRVYPNPVTSNSLNIGYQLPQNKSGVFQIFDVTGKIVFKYNLPPWSNEQSFSLPDLSDGVYSCVIISGNERVSKKIAIIRN